MQVLASPLDCISLSQSVCNMYMWHAHTHARSNTQQGVKVEVGLFLGHFSQTPIQRGVGKEVKVSGGLYTCMHGQCALRRRVAMCACSSSHQGWGKRQSHPSWS